MDEILPPHKPGWLETPPSLIKGIPSLYQLNLTGGLLELESQNRLASVPAVNALGSTRIFKVSGKTANKEERKKCCLSEKSGPEKGNEMGEKHHHNDDDNEGEKESKKGNKKRERKKIKVFLCFVVTASRKKSKEKLPIEPNNQASGAHKK